jgi:hypothetical protein
VRNLKRQIESLPVDLIPVFSLLSHGADGTFVELLRRLVCQPLQDQEPHDPGFPDLRNRSDPCGGHVGIDVLLGVHLPVLHDRSDRHLLGVQRGQHQYDGLGPTCRQVARRRYVHRARAL